MGSNSERLVKEGNLVEVKNKLSKISNIMKSIKIDVNDDEIDNIVGSKYARS